jgi:hypothetical protein
MPDRAWDRQREGHEGADLAYVQRAQTTTAANRVLALARISLAGLPDGIGHAAATVAWPYLCSCLNTKRVNTRVWPSNESIAKATGLSLRAVERGLAYLRDAGKILITYGIRPAGKFGKMRRPYGRIIELHLVGQGPNPRVRFPKPHVMTGLWNRLGQIRARPTSTVALAVSMLVHAAAEEDAEVSTASSVHASLKSIRSLTGARHGSGFTRRLAALERVGLISRVGLHWRDGIVVHPPTEISVRRQPRCRHAPPQLRRYPRQPPCSRLVTLEDLDAMRDSEASARAWTSASWWELMASEPVAQT